MVQVHARRQHRHHAEVLHRRWAARQTSRASFRRHGYGRAFANTGLPIVVEHETYLGDLPTRSNRLAHLAVKMQKSKVEPVFRQGASSRDEVAGCSNQPGSPVLSASRRQTARACGHSRIPPTSEPSTHPARAACRRRGHGARLGLAELSTARLVEMARVVDIDFDEHDAVDLARRREAVDQPAETPLVHRRYPAEPAYSRFAVRTDGRRRR